MSLYIPEIKEEVSENAKVLVEDGGKIVRTSAKLGKAENVYFYSAYGKSIYTDPELTIKLTADGLLETCLNEKVVLVYTDTGSNKHYIPFGSFWDNDVNIYIDFYGRNSAQYEYCIYK